MTPIVSVRLATEQDVVAARQRARRIAELAGFERQDQTRVATAVSEIARNAQMYASGGRADFSFDLTGDAHSLVVRVSDTGPGISSLEAILQGRYTSQTGMGVGLHGARRLVDSFHADTSERGTVITLRKLLPKRLRGLRPADVTDIANKLAQESPAAAWEEVQSQNRELLAALDELRLRQEELTQLNRELEDTNRGVVALYADLDEKAEDLRRANQLKSTFLSHMSHEFRTPLNSILALGKILLGRMDGPLTAEQEKQVEFILRAAQELTDMVNDLLDLAKVEAGKIDIHPTEWTVETLFGTLRGMMRPLVANSPVQLVFEETGTLPPLYTDETKVSQILRNFVSNAIKFTEQGEVRVTASHNERTRRISFAVCDTGIGIAHEDQARIFEQYEQVDSARQRQVKGTGLGLSLSRKFAELLGGTITLRSAPGEGSTFSLVIPASLRAAPVAASASAETRAVREQPLVLLIDDEETARYVVRKLLAPVNVSLVEARSGGEGLASAQELRPDLIILDLMMPGMTGYEVAERLKADSQTRDIPIIVHTSRRVSDADRERLGCSAVVDKDPAGQAALNIHVMEILDIKTKNLQWNPSF